MTVRSLNLTIQLIFKLLYVLKWYSSDLKTNQVHQIDHNLIFAKTRNFVFRKIERLM